MIKQLAQGAACAALLFASAAHAAYPDKPIKIVVPYAPGGFNDTLARVVGKKLQEAWGQPVIVDNRPGAGTQLGTAIAAKSPNDGYTIAVVGFPLVANQFLYKKLQYDSVKAFTGIVLAAQSPNVLVVNASSPIHSLKELVAASKAGHTKMKYATAGTGTSNHLTMEYFDKVAGLSMTQIPYKGSAPMVTDLLGNHVDLMFDGVQHVMPQVKAGKLRALAITSAKRSAVLPDVPTVAESGYPGFQVSVWYGFAAPSGTPQPIIAKLNAEINKILQDQDVKKIFADEGVEAMGGTPQQFDAFFKSQSQHWAAIVKDANISAE
jgi:tripartite-type tricarboxylate transporter receptor subunit TctC